MNDLVRHTNRCVYCGTALTKANSSADHIPPKCIFPRPRPLDTITVQSCQTCNGLANNDDEAFKVAISMQVNPRASLEHAKLAAMGHQSLKANKKLLRDFFAHSKPVWVSTSTGLFVPTRSYLWSQKSFDNTISRITQGLYYTTTKQSLFDLRAKITPQFFGQTDPGIATLRGATAVRSIGKQQFRYSYLIAEEDPRHSQWLFEFYGIFYAGARTVPITAEKGD